MQESWLQQIWIRNIGNDRLHMKNRIQEIGYDRIDTK